MTSLLHTDLSTTARWELNANDSARHAVQTTEPVAITDAHTQADARTGSTRMPERAFTRIMRGASVAGLVFQLALGAVISSGAWASASVAAAPKFVDEEEGSADLTGKKAPDFTLTTLDGKSVTLSKLKGKVVMLDFWASWCGPCRRSMPHLQQTFDQYKDKGLVIVGINVDKEPEKARFFLDKIGGAAAFKYPLALDSRGKVMGAYQVMQMPTAYLIGKDGVVKERIVGFSDDIAARTATSLEALLK